MGIGGITFAQKLKMAACILWLSTVKNGGNTSQLGEVGGGTKLSPYLSSYASILISKNDRHQKHTKLHTTP